MDCGFSIVKRGVEVHWDSMQKRCADSRFGAHDVVTGLWSAIGATKITLTWSNAHSRFRQKQVTYSLRLYTPCATSAPAGNTGAEAKAAVVARLCPLKSPSTGGDEDAGMAAFNEVFYAQNVG